MSGNFCAECACDGRPVDLGDRGILRERNWACPLLGADICETCCQVELAGGMGAPDTLESMTAKTGKSAAEIHAACVACVHGGPELERAPVLLMARGKDGEKLTSGPEFLAKEAELKAEWTARLGRLKEARNDGLPA